jgi:hypothetical protein
VESAVPDRRLIVYPGTEPFPLGAGIEAVGLVELGRALAESG